MHVSLRFLAAVACAGLLSIGGAAEAARGEPHGKDAHVEKVAPGQAKRMEDPEAEPLPVTPELEVPATPVVDVPVAEPMPVEVAPVQGLPVLVEDVPTQTPSAPPMSAALAPEPDASSAPAEPAFPGPPTRDALPTPEAPRAQTSAVVPNVGATQGLESASRDHDGAAAESVATVTAAPLATPTWLLAPTLAMLGVGIVVALSVRRVPAAVVAARPSMEPVKPDDVIGLLKNGHAACERKAYDEALAWFDRAAAAAPDVAVAHFCRGVCLAALDRPEEAVLAFERAMAARPDDVQYRVHFARVAVLLGRTREAMDALSPVATALPELQAAMLDDPQLAGLKDHPRFLAMMGAL